MTYTPTDWVDQETPIDAANLNNLEQGVAAATESAASALLLPTLVQANDGPIRNVAANFDTMSAPHGPVVTFPTGYAGNDVVEPSVLFDTRAPFFADSNGLNGYEYAACMGGYFNTDAQYENPNLWVSHDGTNWIYVVFTNGIGVPTPGYGGVLTPIVPNGVQGDGTNSDPYLVQGPDGTFYILWNQFLNPTGSGGTGTGGHDWAIKGISASSLAGPWSAPTTLVASTMATQRDASPSAVWIPAKNHWQVYCVDLSTPTASFVSQYNIAGSNLLSAWVKQANPSIVVPSNFSTQVWWHHNVYRVGKQLVLLMQDSLSGSSGGAGNLWCLYSKDNGATWVVPAEPMISTGNIYRSAAVMTYSDSGLAFDLFYGIHGTNWQINRTVANAADQSRYGGISVGPTHSLQMPAARIPVAPFLLGDVPLRADSATGPGTADSGQSYTADAGIVGISSHQFYPVTDAANNKIHAVVAGAANGVYAVQLNALPTTSSKQAWLLARVADTNNLVRFGTFDGVYYYIQNIVAGAVQGQVEFNIPIAVGDVWALVCKGANIDCYVNGGKIGSVSYTSNENNSGIGLQGVSSTTRWCNLYMRALVGGF